MVQSTTASTRNNKGGRNRRPGTAGGVKVARPAALRNTTVPAPKGPVNPASLYAFSDGIAVGQEVSLVAVTARVDIVCTPLQVNTRWITETEDGTYVEPHTTYGVLARTDRGQLVTFTAMTVPGLEDETRLVSVPEFI